MTEAISDLPPLDALETATVTFDFSNRLASGVVLVGTPTVLATVAPRSRRSDGNPSGIFQNGPQLGASPRTGAANQAILVQIGNLTAGVTYVLQAYSNDSAGDKPLIRARISCLPPE